MSAPAADPMLRSVRAAVLLLCLLVAALAVGLMLAKLGAEPPARHFDPVPLQIATG